MPYQDLQFPNTQDGQLGGAVTVTSEVGGNNPDLPSGGTQYPLAGRNVSRSGHVIEVNDTPAGERIRFHHRTGSQIDMLPDGSITIGSRGRMVMTINEDMTMTILGDLSYDVRGDMNFNVAGQVNMDCLNFNVTTSGNVTQNVAGSYRTNVGGNTGLITNNMSMTALGTSTSTVLGDNNLVVNGTSRMTSEGGTLIASGDGIRLSSEGEFAMSAPSANLAANSMTVIGATGTIGGEGIIMYNHNMHTAHSVWAGDTVETQSVHASRVDATSLHGYFVGDLDGVAHYSQLSGTFTSQSAASNVSADTTATALPSGAVLTEYLTVSDRGIIQVEVDEESITNMINRNVFNGGLSNRNLSTADLRTLLRDRANRENADLINNHMANGTLGAGARSPAPGSVGRVSPAGSGDQYYGGGAGGTPSAFFTPSAVSPQRRFMPPVDNFISRTTTIAPSLELMPGVRLSTFLRNSSHTPIGAGDTSGVR